MKGSRKVRPRCLGTETLEVKNSASDSNALIKASFCPGVGGGRPKDSILHLVLTPPRRSAF